MDQTTDEIPAHGVSLHRSGNLIGAGFCERSEKGLALEQLRDVVGACSPMTFPFADATIVLSLFGNLPAMGDSRAP